MQNISITESDLSCSVFQYIVYLKIDFIHCISKNVLNILKNCLQSMLFCGWIYGICLFKDKSF